MAKTPIYDPGSSEARSSWLAGLAEACSKISGVLDMATGTFEDLPLPELFISNNDRYRIYQAPSGAKLWLSAVIKKNGVEITEDVSGFTVDYLGGSVVFDADKRLTADDVITASGTYVIGDSAKITSILSSINTLTEQAGHYKGYYATINDLTAGQPTASNGDYAIVGETESFHVWSGAKWVDTVKVTDLSDYYTSADVDDLLDDKQNTIPAHGDTIASDAYYYSGRKTWQGIYEKVLSTALTGFTADDDSAVTAVDTVLTALGKLQAQINSNIHPLKGTGAPTTSTVGVIGQEYINTSNGDVYRCTAIQDGSYTWVQYQDKITGAQGQIVGFDASGKTVAQNPPDTGVTKFNGRTGDVTSQQGDYTAAMVGARPSTWTPTAAEVGALPSDATVGITNGGTDATTASEALKNLITACTALSSSGLATGDYLPLLDASASAGKKVTLANLAAYLQSSQGMAKIATGSYTGTGTYGANNPCTLTFAFVPKLLIIGGNLVLSGDGTALSGFFAEINNRNRYTPSVSISGTTVRWYDSSEYYQLNINGGTYSYVALG